MELSNIVTILIITVFIFLVLLIIGVIKSYKLKAENERLSKETTNNDDEKAYEDFTEGHLY
jgi:heme/copper-type cytochrome/quinol oxidase subunit 2